MSQDSDVEILNISFAVEDEHEVEIVPAPIIVANSPAIDVPHLHNAGIVRYNQDMQTQQEDVTLMMRTEVTPKKDILNPVEAAALQYLLASSETSDSSIIFSDNFDASEKETITSFEGELSCDDEEIVLPSLFTSHVPIGEHLSIGFDITAKYEQFGVLYLQFSKGKKSILIRNYSKFLNFFSLTHDEKRKCVGEYNLYGIGDIHLDLHTNRNEISIYQYSEGGIEMITLTSQDLEDIRICIDVIVGQRLDFEQIELVTKEAIIDIKTELRMYAQRECGACKEVDTKIKSHTCDGISGARLERVLRDAITTYDKWPYSRAIVEIYKRLAKHKMYFKQEFRLSIAWNKRINEVYKTVSLPTFMQIDL